MKPLWIEHLLSINDGVEIELSGGMMVNYFVQEIFSSKLAKCKFCENEFDIAFGCSVYSKILSKEISLEVIDCSTNTIELQFLNSIGTSTILSLIPPKSKLPFEAKKEIIFWPHSIFSVRDSKELIYTGTIEAKATNPIILEVSFKLDLSQYCIFEFSNTCGICVPKGFEHLSLDDPSSTPIIDSKIQLQDFWTLDMSSIQSFIQIEKSLVQQDSYELFVGQVHAELKGAIDKLAKHILKGLIGYFRKEDITPFLQRFKEIELISKLNKLNSLNSQEAVQILEYLRAVGYPAIVRRKFYKNAHKFFCEQRSRVKDIITVVTRQDDQSYIGDYLENKQLIQTQANDCLRWLDEKIETVSNSPHFKEPPVSESEVLTKIEELEREFQIFLSKPRIPKLTKVKSQNSSIPSVYARSFETSRSVSRNQRITKNVVSPKKLFQRCSTARTYLPSQSKKSFV